MKNYEIVEVGPAEDLILGDGPVHEVDVPIDDQEWRLNGSIADVD